MQRFQIHNVCQIKFGCMRRHAVSEQYPLGTFVTVEIELQDDRGNKLIIEAFSGNPPKVEVDCGVFKGYDKQIGEWFPELLNASNPLTADDLQLNLPGPGPSRPMTGFEIEDVCDADD